MATPTNQTSGFDLAAGRPAPSRIDFMRRDVSRVACLALAVGAIVTLGCGRNAPPAPQATRIATIDAGGPAGGYVEALALAPNAGLAATGSRSGQILVWRTTSAEGSPASLGDYRQSIADLAFSPDGRVLASLGRARESAVRLWRFDDRAGSGEWVEAASLPVGRCLALRFDGTGARLAVLCETEVLVVDVASQQVMARLANPHKEVLTAFDLSADGQRLVTAGHDGEVMVRDAVTEAPVRSFNVRRSRRPYPPPRGMEPPDVWGVVVALSGDGSRAAAVTIEGTIYVWDVGTGKQLFDHADGEAGGPPPGSLRFGRDGALLTTMGDRFGMRHIDVSGGASRVVVSAPKAYATVAITDDGTAFAAITSSMDGRRLIYAVEVWQLTTATSVARN
jgi:WD40 repeat protein